MSLGSVKNATASVLDLIASSRAPKPRPDAPAQTSSDAGDGQDFRDSLRLSRGRDDQPSVSDDASDTQVKKADKTDSPGQASTDTGDDREATGRADESAEKPTKADQPEGKPAKDSAEEAVEEGVAQEEQASQPKNSAGTEQVAEIQLALGQVFGGVKAVQTEAEAKAYAGSDRERQALANAAKLFDGSAPQNPKDGSIPIVNTFAFSTTPTTGGGLTDTGGGESQGNAQASAQSVATAAAAQASNTNATGANFVIPDQFTAEAPRPLNTTPGVQQADAARQAQAQPSLSTSDNDSLNTARITRGLANAVQQRGGAVTLRLTPPEMGTVRIQMQITGTAISASFHAETASAQTLLTQQLSQLRTSLETQGMNVERLSVQPMASTSASQSSSQNNNDSQQQNQAQQQQTGGDGRSRGQYSGDGKGQSDGDDHDTQGRQRQAMRDFFDQLNDAADDAA